MIKEKDISIVNTGGVEERDLYDVIIIGGGAIGLFTAFYSGLRGLKTKLIEAGDALGGKVAIGFPDKIISDIGGLPEITGAGLIEQLVQQAKTFEPTIVCGQWVSDLQKTPEGHFRLTTETGEVHYTRSIILTIGSGIIKPLKLDVPGAVRFDNKGVHYLVESYNAFVGKHVLVSGGGDSAVDWANELYNIADSVTVVHRRNEFRAFETNIQKMKERVNMFTPYTIRNIKGKDRIEGVTIGHLETGETQQLEIDVILVNHGFSEELGGIKDWGLTAENGKIEVNDAMETNIPGIFAAGDVVTYPNKLNLFVAGFTEGPMAVNSASRYVNPSAKSAAMYSTHHEKLHVLKSY